MKTTNLGKLGSGLLCVFLLLVFCWTNSAAAQDTDSSKWEFDLTLYLWATDIGGNVSARHGNLPGKSIDVDINDILDNLQMTFMGGFEARKNRWSIIADAIYLSVGNDKNTFLSTNDGATVPASVDLNLDTWILTGAVGYDVIVGEKGRLAVVGGVRYASMDLGVDLGVLGLHVDRSNSEGLLDGIVGVRGVINLNDNWYLPYYADIGAGDSELTWQVLGGLGYRFNWGDIKLVYRYLSYDMEDDGLLQDLNVSGPALGVVFRF